MDRFPVCSFAFSSLLFYSGVRRWPPLSQLCVYSLHRVHGSHPSVQLADKLCLFLSAKYFLPGLKIPRRKHLEPRKEQNINSLCKGRR